MAHGNPKVIMPVGTMNTVADFFGSCVVIEKEDMRNVGQIIVGTQFFGATRHFLGANLSPDGKGATGGAIPGTGGYLVFKLFLTIFKSS